MKRILTIAGIMTLGVALALPVLAQGPGWGRGQTAPGGPEDCPYHSRGAGKWSGDLTDEQRNRLDELYQKFFDQTAQLRSQIGAKQLELNVLMNTSNPDVEKAKALQKDISELRGKMDQERLNLTMEERKIDPNARFGKGWGRGRGYGPHHMNYGRGIGCGRGLGRHGGGYGPGACWN